MKIVFHPEAEAEFEAAIDYYEEKEIGLGYDFSIEVHEAISRSASFPNAWPILETNTRRTLVKRFPFGILYSKENGDIYILAVMNLHRDPDYWKHR